MFGHEVAVVAAFDKTFVIRNSSVISLKSVVVCGGAVTAATWVWSSD